MNRAFEFDTEVPRVSPDIVITPIDEFTGLVVRGVNAVIKAQKRTAQRSLSGHLFFENLFRAQAHLVELDVADTGYFAPPLDPIVMPQNRIKPNGAVAGNAENNQANGDTRIVPLIKRPEAVTNGEALVVRGSVFRRRPPDGENEFNRISVGDQNFFGEWAEGVEVSSIAADGMPTFRSQTDERGNFAIRIRPERPHLDGGTLQVPVRTNVILTFDGGSPWDSPPEGLADLTTHVIAAPIVIA